MSANENKIVGKDAKANFGVRGWILIIFGIMSLFLVGSVQNETMNVIIPKLMSCYGWGDGQISRITTYATIAGALCCFGWGPISNKYGVKKPAIIMLAVVGIGTALTGFVTSILLYAIVRICTVIGTISIMNYFLGIITTNWFPTKKGLAMGYITIGNNLGSMVAIWIMSFFWNCFGFSGGFIAYGCIAIIPIAILAFCLSDYPEQLGLFPDNDDTMTREEAEKLLEEGKRYEMTSQWTVAKLLRTPQVWKVGVSLGLMCLTIAGILTHLVAIFVARGFSSTTAMMVMSVCSVAAIPLSILLGVIDAKIGARNATIFLGIIMAICFFLSIIPTTWSAIFAGFAAAAVMGCLNNVATSLPASVFGRYDLKRAQSCIMPIMQILQAIGVGLTGTVAEMTGSFNSVLLIMGGCSVLAVIILLTLKDECIGRIE